MRTRRIRNSIGIKLLQLMIVFLLASVISSCGLFQSNEQEHSHCWYDEYVGATCTEDGYILWRCDCGEEYIETRFYAAGHQTYFCETVEPTCTEPGYEVYRCDCGYTKKTEFGYAYGHFYNGYTEEWTSSTCTEDGYFAWVCECGYREVQETFYASGHNYSVEVISATCYEGGYSVFTCYCGDNYVGDYTVPAHSGTKYDGKAATCTEIGWKDYIICDNCGYTDYEEIPEIGHDYSGCYYIAPTCTEEGRVIGACGNCGESFDDSIDAIGHTYSDLVLTDGVCNNVSTSFIYCTVCDEVLFSIGHNYKVKVTQATCTEDGKTEYTCIRCDDTYVVTREAVGHIGGEWITVTESTCAIEGEEINRCMVCDEIVDRRIVECKDHTYQSVTLSAQIRYTCSVCNDVKLIDKVNNNHSLNSPSSGGGATQGPKEIYTITFETCGGTEISPLTVVKNEVVDLPAPQKEGCVFCGWYLDSDFTLMFDAKNISDNLTLYALWAINSSSFISRGDNIVTGASSDYTFRIQSSVALNSSNLSNYLSVKDRNNNSIPVYIKSSANNIYDIASSYYTEGETYTVTLSGEANFCDFEGNEFWFKIDAPEYCNIVYRDEVVLISETDVYGAYIENDRVFLVMSRHLLEKDDIAAIYGDNELDIIYAFKVLSEKIIQNICIYEITDVDPDMIFETYSANVVTMLDASGIEFSENLEEEFVDALEKSPLYAQFVQTAKMYAQLPSANNSDLSIKIENPAITVKDGCIIINAKIVATFSHKKAGVAVNDFYIILDVKDTLSFPTEIDYKDVDDYTVIIGVESTLNIELYASADVGVLEHQQSFKNLFKAVRDQGLFEKAEYNGYKFDSDDKSGKKSLSVGRISAPFFGFRIHIDVEVGFNFEAIGTVGAQLVVKNCIKFGAQSSPENGVRFINSHQTEYYIGLCVVGRITTYAYAKVEVGISFAGVAMLRVEAEGGPIFEMGGIFSWFVSNFESDMAARVGGYIRLGVKASATLTFSISLDALVNEIKIFEAELGKWEEEWWLVEVGEEEIPMRFSTQDDEQVLSLQCNQNKIKLDDFVDNYVVMQNVKSGTITFEEQSCAYYIVGEEAEKIATIVEEDGVYYLKVDDYIGARSFEVYVVYGDISKTVKFKVTVGHSVYITSPSTAVCVTGDNYYWRCSRCRDHFYGSGYDELVWIKELPTPSESGHQMENEPRVVDIICSAYGGQKFEYYYCIACNKSFYDRYGYDLISNSDDIYASQGAHVFENKVCACGATSESPVKYIVTFDANGGTCSITTKLVEYNKSYGDLPVPTRDNETFAYFEFMGWYDKNGNEVTSSTVVGAVGDHTLKAKWNKVECYRYYIYAGTDGQLWGSTDVVNWGWNPVNQPLTLTAASVGGDWSNKEISYWAWGFEDTENPTKVQGAELTFAANQFSYEQVVYIAAMFKCFASGTMITMADGTERPIEELQVGDMVLTRNFVTGEFEAAPISLYWYHGTTTFGVLNLSFSGGITVRIITDHGFFDADLNKFVYINEANYSDYIGHNFIYVDGSGNYRKVIFEGAEVTVEETGCYSLRTAINDNAIADGMLTLTPEDIPGMLTYFEVGEDLKYDEEKMNADIEKYGLYTYEEWADYVSYDEFVALNGKYFKILVGKGILNEEDILSLIDGMRA